MKRRIRFPVVSLFFCQVRKHTRIRIWQNGKTPARVARPARKKNEKTTIVLFNDNQNNQDRSTSGRLQGKNFLPTTATAVYGGQPQNLNPEATRGCKK